MTDEPSLLAAIRANPLERTPRLMYADWLDEHDRPRDGAIQRVLAEPERDDHRLAFADWLDENGDPRWAAFIRNHVRCPEERFASSLPMPLSKTIFADECWSGLPASQITLSRGFASRVECTAGYWLQWADAILAAHPVAKVRLTTWPGYQFNRDGRAQLSGRKLDHWVPRGESHDHSQKGIATTLCQMEWPGVEFELPPEPDGMHPNAAGARLVANFIGDSILAGNNLDFMIPSPEHVRAGVNYGPSSGAFTGTLVPPGD